jgi:hypothetical protein
MSWNKYYIIVTRQEGVTPEEVRDRLGLQGYAVQGRVNLWETNKPETLFIGQYRDCILIVDPEMPFQFFLPEPSPAEQLFERTFPDSEIAVLIENGTVNLFGFAIIKKGKRVRMKDGCDGDIYHDIGKPLPEELEISNSIIFPESELEEMREGSDEDEVARMIDFEASWRTTNALGKRYFGVPLGSLDGNEIMLTRFVKP